MSLSAPVLPFSVLDGAYFVEKELGKGSFAVVYRGYQRDNSANQIAVKAVPRSKLINKKLLENLEIEIAILKKIQHPHIVRLVDCERTSTDFYLVMEFCALGDLTYLMKRRDELVEKHPLLGTILEKYPFPSGKHKGLHKAFVLSFLQQLASALSFLRSKNLVHRDIKPQNLLLSTPFTDFTNAQEFHEKGYVGVYNLPVMKVADFGFARFLPSSSMADTLCGSPLYMAPEILNYQKYNAKADLWSVGAVLYEMCCGMPPFRASNHMELFKKIKRANNNITFPSQCDVDPDMQLLISSLLTFDPMERIDFDEFFTNELVSRDLSYYELDNSVPELQKISKSVLESNMFVNEYLEGASENKLNYGRSDGMSEVKNISKTPTSNAHSKVQQIDPHINQKMAIANNKNDRRCSSTELQRRLSSNSCTFAGPGDLRRKLSSGTGTDYQLHQVLRNPSRSSSNSSIVANRNIERLNSPLQTLKKTPTNSEVLVEKEYVVVEKNSVEVNSLADEMARLGMSPRSHTKQLNNTDYMHQRTGSSPSPIRSSIRQRIDYTPMSRTPSNGIAVSSRRASMAERRLSVSSLTPSNALSRALGMASARLFGTGTNKTNMLSQGLYGTAPIETYNEASRCHNQELTNDLILRADHKNTSALYSDRSMSDDDIIRNLETLSAKAFVVYSYAEVKYSQLPPIPINHKNENRIYTLERVTSSRSNFPGVGDDISHPVDSLGLKEHMARKASRVESTSSNTLNYQESDSSDIGTIASASHERRILTKEAIVLYMKVLSILAYSMQMAGDWWYRGSDKQCSVKLNMLVQWIRERFNECLEKAEGLRLSLLDMHPVQNEDKQGFGVARRSVGESLEGAPNRDEGARELNPAIRMEQEVHLESLLYERALEVSKMAAQMELQGEQLGSCEVAYATALWMLETCLDREGTGPDQPGHTDGVALGDQARAVIAKYINSIEKRLDSVRQQIRERDAELDRR